MRAADMMSLSLVEKVGVWEEDDSCAVGAVVDEVGSGGSGVIDTGVNADDRADCIKRLSTFLCRLFQQRLTCRSSSGLCSPDMVVRGEASSRFFTCAGRHERVDLYYYTRTRLHRRDRRSGHRT